MTDAFARRLQASTLSLKIRHLILHEEELAGLARGSATEATEKRSQVSGEENVGRIRRARTQQFDMKKSPQLSGTAAPTSCETREQTHPGQ